MVFILASMACHSHGPLLLSYYSHCTATVLLLLLVLPPTPNNNSSNNNKEAAAFAAARGVSFIFGRFVGQKLEKPVCGFRQQDDVSDCIF